MDKQNERRDFLKQSSLAGVGFWVAGAAAAQESNSPNEKLNIALVGAGGKGQANLDGVKSQNIVALCDVDEKRAEKAFNEYPNAKKYHDYRRMLEEMDKEIDAVVVSVPDHQHAPVSLMAMRMGKHCYCEKPLTHSVEEARLMTKVAREMKVATQMGNQGTANGGLREAVEVVQSGAIGPVREVHVWTNRPIWPQGAGALAKHEGVLRALSVSEKKSAVPNSFKWDLWLGSAKMRPFDPSYAPFAWRGWWDFGTGALGDMACHTANMAYMALQLGAPISVEAVSSEINPYTAPEWTTITFQFPAHKVTKGWGDKTEVVEMPEVKLVWYDGTIGGKRNLPPAELVYGEKVPDSGSLLKGDKGVLFSPNDYGAQFVLLPRDQFQGYKAPEPWIPRSPGHYQEWIRACKGGEPAMANFDYSGPFTEFVLLGNVAARVGKKIEWDSESLRAVNCPEADQYIRREYREGFGV